MAEAISNYQWLIASRMGAAAEMQSRPSDSEALLYYQRALEAELAKVRLEVSRVGVPTYSFDYQGDAAAIAVQI